MVVTGLPKVLEGRATALCLPLEAYLVGFSGISLNVIAITFWLERGGGLVYLYVLAPVEGERERERLCCPNLMVQLYQLNQHWLYLHK